VTKATPIVWNIIEEHFNEAEFLFGQWERALRSPRFDLSDLGTKIEQRLEAHLDGLVVGGPAVAERVLCQELKNLEEPGRAKTAALTLLFDLSLDTANQVVDVALEAEEPLQSAVSRAIILADVAHLDALLLERFREAEQEADLAILLKILTARGVDTRYKADGCLESSCPALTVAALESATRFQSTSALAFAESHLDAVDTHLRKTALIAGITLGSRMAWEYCLHVAAGSGIFDPELQAIIAVLGTPDDHEILYRQLEIPAQLDKKIWVLGFCGTDRSADVCLGFLRNPDERVAKAAADSLAWIGGLDLSLEKFQKPPAEPAEEATLPPIEKDDLNADLSLTGFDDIAVPNPEPIMHWWNSFRDRLVQGRLYTLGQQRSAQTRIYALEVGALWRRHVIGLELAARSGGACQVSTDAFSTRQRRQISALKSVCFSDSQIR